MNTRQVMTFALKVIMSGGLLVFVFSLAPLTSVIEVISSADLGLVVSGSATFLLLHYISAWKLYYLSAPQKITVSVLKLFSINLASHFYGSVLPLGAVVSSVVRWHKISSIDGQRAQAFAVAVLNRIIEFLVVAGIGLGAWALDSHPGRPAAFGGIIALIFGICLFAYGLSQSTRLLAWVNRLVERLGHKIPFIAARINKITTALSCYPHLTLLQHSRLLAISIVRNLAGVLALYLLCQSIDIEVSPFTIAWVRAATTIVVFLPLSMLGLGVREASFLYLLHPFGVQEASAVALGLLYLAANLGIAGIGGLIEAHVLFTHRRSPRKRSISR